jgi:hypothetical protein
MTQFTIYLENTYHSKYLEIGGRGQSADLQKKGAIAMDYLV